MCGSEPSRESILEDDSNVRNMKFCYLQAKNALQTSMGTTVVLVLCKWLVLPHQFLNKGFAVCKLLVHLAKSRLLCASQLL